RGVQMTGDDEAVTAVVARAADDRHAVCGREALPDLVRRREAGPLHQHRARQAQAFDGGAVEDANLVRVVEGKQSAHGSCTIATAPAIPRECVIERSIAPAPSRRARSATWPDRVTAGFGRPAISMSRHMNSTPHPIAFPTASLPANRAAKCWAGLGREKQYARSRSVNTR